MAVREQDDVPAGKADAPRGTRLRGAPAVRLHVTLAVGLTICVGAFVIEVGRALGGNSLSWAYVFEWPIFAVFAVYMWWNLLHDRDGGRRNRREAAAPVDAPSGGPSGATSATGPAPSGAGTSETDPELAAWQEYLRGMEAEERRQADQDGAA